ncbi:MULTISPECIES: hypothetical protein [Xanthomonas]|uniref:hypothetical protein n=1 Tax=Xanthomonas TaxID=338 RepID=UPI001ADA22E2|nr:MULTISPECIES: hypothetical protein [unclassified Xanthomonas]MBO9874630.1 hypothetical protein [Xanthomonas sp. D-93]WNH43778.1 hypothetical protein PG878_14760 [Xanthomonas sp. A6251]
MLFAVLKEPLVRQRLFLCLVFAEERDHGATSVPARRVPKGGECNDACTSASRECRTVFRR